MLSCEPCRRKKCKCDRKLPHCSPCASDPASCRYTASSKRGLPNGYLNKLEQRLAETELALYETLVESSSSNPQGSSLSSTTAPRITDLSKSLPTKSKTSRMQEWEQFPLQHRSQRERWWLAKSQEFSASLGDSSASKIADDLLNGESGEEPAAAESESTFETSIEQSRNQAASIHRLDLQPSTALNSSGMHQPTPGGSISRIEDLQRSPADISCESPNTSTISTGIAFDPTETVAPNVPEHRVQTENARIHPILEDRNGEGGVESLDSAGQLSKMKWQTYF